MSGKQHLTEEIDMEAEKHATNETMNCQEKT